MRPGESNEDTIEGLLAGMSRELRCSIWFVIQYNTHVKREPYLLIFSFEKNSLFNFKEATSTPCGHTFCNECITQHLLHKTVCPLCNQEMVVEDLHHAYSVQAIVKEFKKMRDQFEQERDVNLSQLPIQYLSHQDTLDQNTPRSSCKLSTINFIPLFFFFDSFFFYIFLVKVTNSEGPLSNARESSSHAKVYLGNNLDVRKKHRI